MNPRQTAALALLEMDRREGYSNLTLEPRLQRAGFSPQDRAFCSALFYGVLERRITLDWAMKIWSDMGTRRCRSRYHAPSHAYP